MLTTTCDKVFLLSHFNEDLKWSTTWKVWESVIFTTHSFFHRINTISKALLPPTCSCASCCAQSSKHFLWDESAVCWWGWWSDACVCPSVSVVELQHYVISVTYAIKACLRHWDRRNDLVWCVWQSGMRNHKWFRIVTRERLKNSADANYRSQRGHAAGKDRESLREICKIQAFKYCEKNRWRKQSDKTRVSVVFTGFHKTCQVTWKSDKRNILYLLFIFWHESYFA